METTSSAFRDFQSSFESTIIMIAQNSYENVKTTKKSRRIDKFVSAQSQHNINKITLPQWL